MEKEQASSARHWNPRLDELRLGRGDRYVADHPRGSFSPISPRSPFSNRSSPTAAGSPFLDRIPTSAPRTPTSAPRTPLSTARTPRSAARTPRSAARTPRSAPRTPLSAQSPTSAEIYSGANSAGRRGTNYATGKKLNYIKRHSSVSDRKEANPLGTFERRKTITAGESGEDPFGLRGIHGDAPSQPSKGNDVQDGESDDEDEARETYKSIGSLESGSVNDVVEDWKAHLDDRPYSPSTNAPSEAEQGLEYEDNIQRAARIRKRNDSLISSRTSSPGLTVEVKADQEHDSGDQSPESEQADGISDEIIPKPRLTNVPNEGDNRQGHIEQMKEYAKKHPLEFHPGDRDSDALSNDDSVIVKDFALWNPPHKREHEQERDHDLQPESPEPDHGIDETIDRENHAVSDLDRNPDETTTSSETSSSFHSNKPDLQPGLSIPDPTLLKASPIHDPDVGQVYPEINDTEEEPNPTYFPNTMEVKSPDSPPNLLGSDQIKSPDSQSKLPGSDQTKIPDSQAQSPEPGGVTVDTSPTQDQVKEGSDAKAWFNSDSPLPGKYKAFFGNELDDDDDDDDDDSRSPGAISPTDGIDSLVVSPVLPGELYHSEEDDKPNPAVANGDFMKKLAEYKANFHLELPPERKNTKKERRAKAATDRPNGRFQSWSSESSSTSGSDSDEPLILSPGQYGEGSISPEILETDVENAKEKAASQAVQKLLELQGANFVLQNTLEEKEARFKRDIKIALTRPRPPPTTAEQRQDRLALEKIQDIKEIFDESGEQQRPIATDPRLVLVESEVNMLITRARVNYLLENYPKMHAHAYNAVAAAGQLRFPALTARCRYYRGLASYNFRDFDKAKDDFLASRACAGLYGISGENIEKHIELIDKADNPETAVLERFPNPKFVEVRRKKRTTTRRADVGHKIEPLSPIADDNPSTPVRGSPTSPQDIALPPSTTSSPNDIERSAVQPPEDTNPQIQTLHTPPHLDRPPLGRNPQPGTDDIPIYQPQDESISEEIRKDIFESKAQSLAPASAANPAEAKLQGMATLSPPSMASTERTLLGSATSQGTERRHVPRPYVAPITTSFARATGTTEGQASPEGTLVSGSTDLMDADEIMAAFNTERDDATPVTPESGFGNEMDGDESD